MANLLRYTPADDAFDDLMRGFFMRPVRLDTAQTNQIRLDVSEDDKAYTVQAEIPGVRKEDIKVSIEGSQVAISAEVKNEKTVNDGGKLLRSERQYGRVARAFSLAQEIDETTSEARYQDGVLVLNLPKRAATHSKNLTIR